MPGDTLQDLTPPAQPWLLLLHQLPPKPAYFRVKIWRRLQRLGAVLLKNSVYVLPSSDQTLEDFQWIYREIIADGGEATVCQAHFVEGLSDEQVRDLFRSARDADYAPLIEEGQGLLALVSPASSDGHVSPQTRASLARLKRRLQEVIAIDFFRAPARTVCDTLVSELERRLHPMDATHALAEPGSSRSQFQGRTWVTRQGIKIDRMASAWLIRRFIDPRACFRFVLAEGFVPEPDDVRFDMFEAEFTHQGDLCTFEVLIRQFGLEDPALGHLAQIVHDIDLKDPKYGRSEASGIERMVLGITAAHLEDADRLERGSALFEDLYAAFLH